MANERELTAKAIGVAISGGGHRAALWGAGVLMFLVDKGLNQQVTTIASVSGGSIVNGVVGLESDFRRTNGSDFRAAIGPMLKHIAHDGLFFYGSTTNSYLAFTLSSAAVAFAAWGLVVGVVVWQAALVALQALGFMPDKSLATLTLRPAGVALVLAFLGLGIGAYKYAKQWSWSVLFPSLAGVAVGVAVVLVDLNTTRFRWPLLPALATVSIVAVLITVLALSAFGRRSRVAERAMRDVHFGTSTVGDLGLKGGGERVGHVICATEIQSGLHAFFSDAFIYSYVFGISPNVGSVSLAFAVQASAALPGGFAPRRLDASELNFVSAGAQPVGYRRQPLILMDGGVYDNMADQWFVGLSARRERWPGQFAAHIKPVDHLIVANASTGWVWQPLGRLAQNLHTVREAAALGRVFGVLYNTLGRRRRAHLNDRWRFDGFGEKGAFVEVNDNPLERASDALKPRVEEIAPAGGWEALVERSRIYPTVLRQVPWRTCLEIMWHAYIVSALSVARFFEVPMSDSDLPTFESFEDRLRAQGLPA